MFFGFKLVPDAYPDWITITRPYYRGAYVYVAADPAWKSLGDMPTTRAIGATIGTSADMRLIAVSAGGSALTNAGTRYPMASDEAALRAVMQAGRRARRWSGRRRSGRCGRPMPASPDCRRWRPSPLPVSTADVGAILLRKQTFLRSSLDQAIASLTADGTIAGILKDANFPGAPVPR